MATIVRWMPCDVVRVWRQTVAGGARRGRDLHAVDALRNRQHERRNAGGPAALREREGQRHCPPGPEATVFGG